MQLACSTRSVVSVNMEEWLFTNKLLRFKQFFIDYLIGLEELRNATKDDLDSIVELSSMSLSERLNFFLGVRRLTPKTIVYAFFPLLNPLSNFQASFDNVFRGDDFEVVMDNDRLDNEMLMEQRNVCLLVFPFFFVRFSF